MTTAACISPHRGGEEFTGERCRPLPHVGQRPAAARIVQAMSGNAHRPVIAFDCTHERANTGRVDDRRPAGHARRYERALKIAGRVTAAVAGGNAEAENPGRQRTGSARAFVVPFRFELAAQDGKQFRRLKLVERTGSKLVAQNAKQPFGLRSRLSASALRNHFLCQPLRPSAASATFEARRAWDGSIPSLSCRRAAVCALRASDSAISTVFEPAETYTPRLTVLCLPPNR